MERKETERCVQEDADASKQIKRIGLLVIAAIVAIGLVRGLFRHEAVSQPGKTVVQTVVRSPLFQADTFRVQENEIAVTMYNDSAIGLRICANHPWLSRAVNEKGRLVHEYRMSAGCSVVGHASFPGVLQVRGLYNGTVLRMRQIPTEIGG